MQILLASTNLHKIREFKEMFRSLPRIEILSLHQFQGYVQPEETGVTFKENAILKAEHAAKHLNIWAIADDSGLVVPALKGEPGVHSARYAGMQKTDADNRKKLLEEMQHLCGDQRSAYCECALALANPAGLVKCVQGTCEGFISEESKGRNGFGYDPLFIKNDYDKTFAELDETLKNKISHRRKAFERLVSFLDSLPQ